MLSLQKNKHHKRRRNFFKRGVGNSLKQTYVDRGGTCKTNKNEQWGKEVENWKFRAKILFCNHTTRHFSY